MHRPYPGELRTRVIDFVEGGGSRRGAAEQFEVSVSSAIRWVQRFREDGTCEPMPRGGSTSPLEKHSRQILALISAQRDLTLDEIVSALHKRRIPGSRSALSRFFARHGITIKKSLQAAERKRADVACARRRWIREQGFLDPTHLIFIDETAVTTNMVRLNGWNPRGERLHQRCTDGSLGDGDVYRWPASNWHCGADADQRSHEWRGLPGLHRAMFGPNTQAEGRCGGRQRALPQGCWWRTQSRLSVQVSDTCPSILRTLTR
jgi:transposase